MNYKKEEIIKTLKEKTLGKISEEQIEEIVENLEDLPIYKSNINPSYGIIVTSNPDTFDGQSNEIIDHFVEADRYCKPRVLMGDYTSGKNEWYERPVDFEGPAALYLDDLKVRGLEDHIEQSDFNLREIQVVISNVTDVFIGFRRQEKSQKIVVYIPDENIEFDRYVDYCENKKQKEEEERE